MIDKRLPSLIEVVKGLEYNEKKWLDSGGWNNFSKPLGDGWHFPGTDFINDADNEKFIVVETESGRHTLKPNLARRPYLYRGQNKQYRHIVSSFGRDELPGKDGQIDRVMARKKHIVANLKSEEFIALLRSHPLFTLLDRGVFLQPEKRTVFINMNYYGLSQHYGFKTGVVDFTTDVNVAAFFACTKNLGNDQYEPITDVKTHKTGVLYVHRIEPMTTFKNNSFSTIGLQIYPRSGVQKGVLYNEGITYTLVDEMVEAIPFRHDALVSRHFFKMMNEGKKLFPADVISKYAKEILNSKDVSGEIFALNLYSNHDDYDENLAALAELGISVNWHKCTQITPDMLHEIFMDVKNGLWEHFCNQIYFADEKIGAQMHESLLNLPSNPAYHHFFDEKEYRKINVYENHIYERAVKNAKRSRAI